MIFDMAQRHVSQLNTQRLNQSTINGSQRLVLISTYGAQKDQRYLARGPQR
jgi:predicted regulator of Ras-like GTPase activity (Roadblock/LC7/MglB family)